jgi:hypothetical protein
MSTATLERPAQLEYATIVVAYVNPPKPGQKSASIKDTDGLYYWIKPAEMPLYQVDGKYEISFITTQSNGYTNRTIKSVEAVQQRAQPARQAAPPQQRTAPMQQQQAPQSPPNGNGFYRPTHPRDAERMFVCASLGHFIDRGTVTLDSTQLVDAVNVIRAVWQATFGADPE